MNTLLVIGLVLFACAIIWVYVLFMTNTMSDVKKNGPEEIVHDDTIERCKSLLEQGHHAELQRFAQRELSKDYSNTELRKILAQSLMMTGNDQMATAHYEAVLNITPYDIETQEILLEYYLKHGPKARMIELCEQILMNDSGNIRAAETLAGLYEEFSNFDKAIEMYNVLIEAEVDEEKILKLKYTLADLYIKSSNNEKAFETYEKIYEQNPQNLEILVILADLAYKNEYLEDCLKYYKKIISIVGEDFEILEKIASIYVMLEDWQEAALAYKKIISLEDKNSQNFLYHQNEMCNAMLKNKQYYEAIDILKDLTAQYPKETSFAFTLAQAYTIIGEFQIGVNLYGKLLENLPPEQSEIIKKHISSLICAWAQNLFDRGEYNQAFDKFFEALKYSEDNDEVYYQLGRCNYFIKSFQDSIAHFKKAIAIKPQESRYYFGLGCAYEELGSIKNAKNAFYDAININPMNTQARIAYAISLTKELEYAQSIEQFSEVLKYAPDDPDTLYNLALAYELVRDSERAIKFYKKALESNKNHKEAHHNLELLLGEPYNIEDDEYVEEEGFENEVFETDEAEILPQTSDDETSFENFAEEQEF